MTGALTRRVRVFQNTPMFNSPGEAAAYLERLWPLRAKGFVAADRTIRLLVELQPTDEQLKGENR